MKGWTNERGEWVRDTWERWDVYTKLDEMREFDTSPWVWVLAG